jgi:predicted DNA-binding protein
MSDMASERITIRVPAVLAERLRSQSSLKGRNGSRLIREALESYLDKSRKELTAYEAAQQLGLIGGISGLPRDLSTHPRHMKGFGGSSKQ